MSKCAHCQHFTLKDQPHIKLALFRCALGPPFIYRNPFMDLKCPDFKQVSEADMPARLAFEGKQ